MDIEKIKQIGKENGLSGETLELFTKFFSKRFPNESNNITSYAEEWAKRFSRGTPQVYMDNESLKIYKEVL